MNSYRLKTVACDKADYDNSNEISLEFIADGRERARDMVEIRRNDSPQMIALKLRALADRLEQIV